MTIQTLIKLVADGAVLPIIVLAGYALLFLIPKGARFEAYARILMAGLTAYLLAKLLGAVYQPATERPFEILGVAAGASYLNNPGFPSDHALFAAFLTLAVWFETRHKWISITLAILTVAVCVGRVLALVHTPLDVIGGILVASVGALWYLQRDEKIFTKPTRQKHQNSLQ
ncbi:MAG: Phosphoesterase, PA-phosphatase related protein [Candidatus Saccharibacteria bacterium]|nr:Phosphoesterase, PA-phosphatase related protein [Candidatus Saccharibacteria bacterium]